MRSLAVPGCSVVFRDQTPEAVGLVQLISPALYQRKESFDPRPVSPDFVAAPFEFIENNIAARVADPGVVLVLFECWYEVLIGSQQKDIGVVRVEVPW